MAKRVPDAVVVMAREMRAAGIPLAEVSSALGVSVPWVSQVTRGMLRQGAPGPVEGGTGWISPDTIAQIKAEMARGGTVRGVAADLGLSPSTVQRAMRSPRV